MREPRRQPTLRAQVTDINEPERHAKCRAPRRCWVSSANEAGVQQPCSELYRQMFNPSLYLLAYGKIYANQGAMTPGASAETADGMSGDKIHKITGAMRAERYRFSPARGRTSRKRTGKCAR